MAPFGLRSRRATAARAREGLAYLALEGCGYAGGAVAELLAWTIHERHVNNPGLPDQAPFPFAAGGYLRAGGRRAVSRGMGDA